MTLLNFLLVVFILTCSIFAFKSALASEDREVKLSQVDVRRRLSFTVKIKNFSKIKIRPYIEYRYKPKP